MAGEMALLAAQRVAIQDLRTRFERGELPIETFRETLDALVLARDPDECQSLMSQLARRAAEHPERAGASERGSYHAGLLSSPAHRRLHEFCQEDAAGLAAGSADARGRLHG